MCGSGQVRLKTSLVPVDPLPELVIYSLFSKCFFL